jgi:proline iminopeptidase
MGMLYPPIEPHRHGVLDVGDGHQLYWEECGHPQGLPVVFLHGGPGAGCSAQSRQFFHPEKYRAILFDQRGCGRSTPHGSTKHNDLAHLVSDLERLRQHCSVESWVLFGGSWGSTLALAYAQAHPTRVKSMVLRGVFTASQDELAWLYAPGGASQLFPDQWTKFSKALGEDLPEDLLASYAHRLHDGEREVQVQAALAWCEWEDSLCSIESEAPSSLDPDACWAMARISAHMFAHDADLKAGFAWQKAHGQVSPPRSTVPCMVVQGRFDVVTPMATAWALHQAWPGSELRIVHNAGHSSLDSALQQALVETLDSLVFH